MPRGEFNIVIAGLAATAGVPGIGPLAACYVMIMAVAGPVLARAAGGAVLSLGSGSKKPGSHSSRAS